MHGLVALYIPAQMGVALVLYDGESLTGLGTVLATHSVTLVINDELAIEADEDTPTLYRVKVNGSTIISKTISAADLSTTAQCVGVVRVATVPDGTIPTPGGGGEDEPIMIIVKPADESRHDDDTTSADSDLTFLMEAGKTYTFSVTVSLKADSGLPDIKYTMLAPGDAEGNWSDINEAYTTLAFGDDSNSLNTGTFAEPVQIEGAVTCVTAGNLSFGWSQFTSNSDNTTVGAFSKMVIFEVA